MKTLIALTIAKIVITNMRSDIRGKDFNKIFLKIIINLINLKLSVTNCKCAIGLLENSSKQKCSSKVNRTYDRNEFLNKSIQNFFIINTSNNIFFLICSTYFMY